MAQLSDKDIERRAQELLDWVASLDPTWTESIRVAREENRWTARQCVGAWLAYVLEQQLHMAIPMHPAFEVGFTPPESPGVCDVCQEPFKPLWAGQRTCSNDCGLISLGRRPAPQPEPFPTPPPAELPADTSTD